MRFKIIYILFLVACFFYPFEYIIGSVAIRHILSWILLIMLVAKRKIKFDWVLWLFVFYLFFFIIASLVTGYISEFLPTLVGTYITCIIMYLATKTMMEENGGKWILYTLLAIAVIDSVVTIAQFFNLSIAKTIADALRINLIDEEMWDKYETYGGGMGGIVAGGLLRGVKNGYFLCAAVVFSLINKDSRTQLINVALCVLLLAALFFTQERAAFFLGILCLSLYIIIGAWRLKRRMGFVLLLVAIVSIVLFINIKAVVDIGDMRYVEMGGESSGREVFWKNAFAYVLINPMGGSYDFYAKGGYVPHSFIPHSFLNGGIFGGTIVIALVFAQIYLCIKVLYEALFKQKHSMLMVAMALIYLGYTGNSCFHNLCLATGDETAFLWWAILAFLLEKENKDAQPLANHYSTINISHNERYKSLLADEKRIV